jgi:hypothetical protein
MISTNTRHGAEYCRISMMEDKSVLLRYMKTVLHFPSRRRPKIFWDAPWRPRTPAGVYLTGFLKSLCVGSLCPRFHPVAHQMCCYGVTWQSPVRYPECAGTHTLEGEAM